MELETTYGRQKGVAAKSVNGTSVLARMFSQAGYKVRRWQYLSPKLEHYDVVVWAPDDFGPPSQNVRQFFHHWLEDQDSKRTLVFIGRDYDAASEYWRQVLSGASSDQRLEVMRRLGKVRAAHDVARYRMPADECAEWFTMRRDEPKRHVKNLAGPWSDGIDGGKANIWTEGCLDIPTRKQLQTFWKKTPPPVYQQPDFEVLLSSGTTTLVSRITKSAWGDNSIIVVNNGSFLLNFPLVNHQHRRLAGKLIRECGSGKKAAFLETSRGWVLVKDFDPNQESLDDVRRRVLLAAHWFVLGVLFCFSIFPIFGRPKPLKSESVADFGTHIDAVAALLMRTGDQAYARTQLDQYRDAIAPESASRAQDVAQQRATKKAD